MVDDYDLKKSSKIGMFTPVLVNQDGEVIDGRHRCKANPKWPRFELELSPLQTHVARLMSNSQRRAPESDDFNELAEFLLKTENAKRTHKPHNEPERQCTCHVKSGLSIAERIQELTTWSEDTVREYLDEKYKQPQDQVGDTPTQTLGIGRQVRVPHQFVEEVDSIVQEAKTLLKENPSAGEETIKNVKNILQQTKKGLSMRTKAEKAVKKSAASEAKADPDRPTTSEERTAFSILNTLTPEDRKVFEELRNKGGAGKYLEKKVGEVGAKTVMDHIKVITGIMPLRVTGLIKPLLRLTLSTPLRCPSCKFEFTLDPAKPVDWWEKLQFTIAKQDEQRFMDLLKKLAESKSIEEMAPFAEVP